MYLEIDEGFLEHPKTMQLCSSMGNPLAFGHLLHFWRWACRSCKDGNLTGLTPYVIEEAARYYQHDGKLYAALIAQVGDGPGFIDVDASGNPIGIHNWAARTGGGIKRMEDKAAENKKRRADAKAKHDSMEYRNRTAIVPESYQYGTGTEPVQIPPRQDKTRPVQTSPDQTRQDQSPDPDPRTQTRARVGRSEPGKPTARHVADRFGAIRAEICGTKLMFWQASPAAIAKLSSWLADMDVSAVPDIEAAIRLACEKQKSSAPGWTNPDLADPNYLLGAVVGKWSALREELNGCAPKVAEQESASSKPVQSPVKWPRLGQ